MYTETRDSMVARCPDVTYVLGLKLPGVSKTPPSLVTIWKCVGIVRSPLYSASMKVHGSIAIIELDAASFELDKPSCLSTHTLLFWTSHLLRKLFLY